MAESAEKLLTLTHKQIVDAAIEASVRGALEAVGLDVIKSEPFFGMGERSQVVQEGGTSCDTIRRGEL